MALTQIETAEYLKQCSDEQLAELAIRADAKIVQHTHGLAAATASRPSYAPKGQQTKSERTQDTGREEGRRQLVKIQAEQAKRAGSGTRTLISILRADGSIKTIVRPTVFTETQRVAFIADAKSKNVAVIGWMVVS